MNLEELRKHQPKDAEVIEHMAKARIFWYDGPGAILPSGMTFTGAELRRLVAEAGYNTLSRDYDYDKESTGAVGVADGQSLFIGSGDGKRIPSRNVADKFDVKGTVRALICTPEEPLLRRAEQE